MARPVDVPGPPSADGMALLLNAEVSSVLTAMKANAKWAVVPSKYNVSAAILLLSHHAPWARCGSRARHHRRIVAH